MRVVDVDSHFFEPPDWLAQVDPGLAAEMPEGDAIESVVRFVVGDLLDTVSRDRLPDDLLELLAPAGHRALTSARQGKSAQAVFTRAIALARRYCSFFWRWRPTSS